MLCISGLNDLSVYEPDEEIVKDVKPSNPFIKPKPKKTSLLEIALEVLQTMTCRKGPSKESLVCWEGSGRGGEEKNGKQWLIGNDQVRRLLFAGEGVGWEGKRQRTSNGL